MATLIAYQDGNWTGATTWKAVATGTGASQTVLTTATSTATSYVASSAFIVTNAEVLEGLLLFGRRVNTIGTVSVALSDDNGTTATREVTVNASDLPDENGWIFFKFASTLTADGGSDYKVLIKGSSLGNATFYRDATAGNWARIIRKSDTASIATTDVVYICDELTGAGTKNDITVTMDSTATTAYGDVNIGQGGVLSYGTSASTNYYLKLTGNLNVWGGGTLNVGTSASRIPSTSTAVLEFNCGSNVQYGLEVRDGGTCNIYGATRTNTKVLLTADANSGQKVVTVQDTTGWAANDEIAIAGTNTSREGEKLTVSTVDSGTQATMTANLTSTHSGTSPFIGEVINLTRNVKIRGVSASLNSYVNLAATSSFTAEYAEFNWLGSATASKRGIDVATSSSGAFSAKYCSFRDWHASGQIRINNVTVVGDITDCVFYAPSSSDATVYLRGASFTFENNWMVQGSTGISYLNAAKLKGNRVANCTVGIDWGSGTSVNFESNVIHSGSQGITTGNAGSVNTGEVKSLTAWRLSSTLLSFGVYPVQLQFTDCSFYNGATHVSSGFQHHLYFKNCTFDNFGGNTTTNQISGQGNFTFDACSFGVTNKATNWFNASSGPTSAIFRNCTISDTIAITSQTNLTNYPDGRPSVIGIDKLNATSGSHRAYKAYGYTASDQTTYRTAAPSEALIPNNASNKLPSGSKKFAVANGTTATVTVYVNKSATYNGNQPRLIVKRNIVGGITTDTVLATAVGGTGSWLVLSGTTASVTDNCVLEVYVDCDGTAGTVYVDDWSVS